MIKLKDQLDAIKGRWPEISDWLSDFLKNPYMGDKGLNVMKALTKVLNIDPSGGLLREVLWACYQAATFNDLPRKRRQRDSALSPKIAKQRAAVKTLRAFLENYPDAASGALLDVYMQWVVPDDKNIPPACQLPTDISRVKFFDTLLAQYDSALSHKILGIKCGPYLHRFRAGPLLYPKPLDTQKAQPDAALNGLLFQLAFFFHLATSKNPVLRQSGTFMPTSGRPNIPLVTFLAAVTLDKYGLDENQVKLRIRGLVKSGVGLMTRWPADLGSLSK